KENADNSENSNDTVANSGYKGFSNLDLIYNNYKTMTNADRRYAYRLDKSYLEGAYADSDKINIENIYQATYKNENGYISDFVTNDNKTIPLVVFRSTENGSLDEVIQTYVNMLTNNSGALNTYSNQEIVVTTQKKVLSNGVIYDGEGQAAVQVVELGNNKYQFENKAEDGTNLYDQMTDAQNVTFSLISISYNYNGNQKWKLQIPVYVEQELEFDSHMRLVKGIEYNVDTVKKGAYYNENSKDLTTIDRGESYTLYLEYVYGEARVRYTNATIPKQLSMEYVGDSNEVSFLKNTQFTLIDLKNGGKPYYYVADGSDGSILDFENFKDSAGNPYTARNINECAEYPDTFTDVCGFEKQNVAVENYLLLVDTSQVEKAERETRGNVIYTLKTDISELETKNERLYSQLEYTDHCSVRVQEIIGVSCSFSDEDVFSEQLEGAITEGGSVALPLQYNVTITNAWKNTNSSTPVYLDIAVSLQKKANNTTQTVALPVGTQVYFEMLNEDSNTYTRSDTGYTVQGNGISDVYYYADSNSEIKLTDFDPDKQFTKTIRIILDFSMADMSSFENAGNDAEYGIAADLLISTDQENPGNGEVRDSVYRTVKVDVSSELGFALQPNDLITLGINRYQSGDTDTGIMPFAAKIAFPEDYTQDDVKGKYYSIVYKLEEKTTRQDGISAPLYKLYTGNGVKLYQGTEVNDSKDLAFNWSEDHSVRYYYCSLAGTDLDISKSIATIDFVLSAGEDMDYTNYRITGYLIISDSELSNPVSAIQDNSDLNSDFFVYTIANIKTDLN
ncbi:MAG: hypothetical protein II250_02140, partial [Agathobacter sp.]|nr:hypothetical protein [Agathobacter sp.]